MAKYQVVGKNGQLDMKSVPEILDENPEQTFDEVLERIHEGSQSWNRDQQESEYYQSPQATSH